MQSQLSDSQRVHQFNPNPNNITLSLPDDKPLSPISVMHPSDKLHLFRKECQDLISELQKLSGYAELDYHNGTYYGQVVNEKKHGRGLMIFEDRICEGMFQNDRKHGHCRESFDNGEYFEGEFQNGKPHGVGVYRKLNESYNGNWINGFKNGHGVWMCKEDNYEGEWRFGKIDGYGVFMHGKDKYTGSFRNNLKHGHGVETFNNGDIYNGQYVNGKPEGEGTYIWANGTEYRGSFKNGVRYGNGVWMKWDPFKEGHYRYEGMFENDKKHGQGVFIWPSGNKYIGQFVNDYRHGYGEMYWKDHYYKGQWERGMQHGDGELSKNGVVKKGKFENNTLITTRSHSMWEQHNESFSLNADRSFQINNTKIKYMPSIGRKPKMISRQGNRSVILDHVISPELPIEDDPDFLTAIYYPQPKAAKVKKNICFILKKHFNSIKF